MKLFEAADFDTAQRYVLYLAETSDFSIFRGQRRHWPLIPSLARLDQDARAELNKRLAEFLDWSRATPAMAPYVESDDAAIAIAQHYGIGTNLLDWTYNPAAALFFALDGAEPNDQERAVVFCARVVDIARIEKCRLIEINVPNLWRLEAQAGLFVEVLDTSSASALEDRCQIVTFPKPTQMPFERSAFYPARKSDLEIKIDQYLQLNAVEPVLRELAAATKFELRQRWRTYPGAFFGRMASRPNDLWENSLPTWNVIRVEELSTLSRSVNLKIAVPNEGSVAARYTALRDHFLRANEIRRRLGAVNFRTRWERTLREIGEKADKALNTYWDGVRRLPFSNESIAEGLAALTLRIFEYLSADVPIENTFGLLFGETIIIEFADFNGLNQAGIASKLGLADVVSAPMLDTLTPYVRRRATERPEDLFCFVLDCAQICDLHRLSTLMAREVVPAQVAMHFVQALTNDDWDAVFEAPSYDPTNLGYFSTSRFRFDFPFVVDPQPEDTIFLFTDMTNEEIAARFSQPKSHVEEAQIRHSF